MIITIEDSFGREISQGDIVLLRYPNPRIFYLGIFTFRHESCDFVLTDGDTGWTAFPDSSATVCERICTAAERPELDRWQGRNECKEYYATRRFLAIVENMEQVPPADRKIVHLEKLSKVC